MDKIYTLRIPVDEINKAILAAANSKIEQDKIDEERRAAYPVEDPEIIRKNAGEDGARLYLERVLAWDDKKKSIAVAAVSEINDIYKDAVAFIDAETLPNGADVTGENAGDFALLTAGLIETPEKLRQLCEKHSNPAFLIAAQRYAADPSREWEGFAFFTKENSIRDYVKQIFDNLVVAATLPDRPLFLQYVTTPTEYFRIAKAYGLEEEFLASKGDKLSKAIYNIWPK